MYKVLLVDDEPLVRNDLRSLLDYRAYGFEICGEAQNAEKALDMIVEAPPDIAIIDVNMPGMNGVDLNRTIKERNPSVQTIMLSSYDDYDYVRDCLKNGSIDYLLKHRLDGETLLALLNKAIREKQTTGAINSTRESGTTGDDPLPYRQEVIRQSIADLVKGKAGATCEFEAGAFPHRLYPQAALYTAVVLQIVPFLLLTESNTDVQTNRLVQQAVKLMQQSLGDIRERTATYVENGRIAVVFSFRERSEHAAVSEAARSMSSICHALEMFLNIKSIYEVGHLCGSLAKLAESYASAERALDKSIGMGTGSEKQEPHLTLSLDQQKQLLIAIERLDVSSVQRLINSVFEPLRSLPLHSHAVQTIVSEFLHIGDKAFKKKSLSFSGKAEWEGLSSRSEVSRLGSVVELEEWLQSLYGALLRLLKEQHNAGTYSRHVSHAIGFIMERYSSLVTLELTADFIGLNASYLSRIFKEETKSTFSEYVNRVRLDAARALLESGQYSIKQVSDQVGFSTHNYFFKVFKEATGMTPQAYWGSFRDSKTAVKKM